MYSHDAIHLVCCMMCFGVSTVDGRANAGPLVVALYWRPIYHRSIDTVTLWCRSGSGIGFLRPHSQVSPS